MYKRILALSFLFFTPHVISFADTQDVHVEVNEEDIEDIVYEEEYDIVPQIYLSLSPKIGINFISGESIDTNKFSILKSNSFGGTFAVNMPIKQYNFFYTVAFDLTWRKFAWNQYKNFYTRSVLVGGNKDNQEFDEILQKDFEKGINSTSLSFLDFDVILQFGYKNNIIDHRRGFFCKGLLGIGFLFSKKVKYTKDDMDMTIVSDDNIPMKNIKFLWGVDIGYWRIGLNFTSDFFTLFSKEEENYSGKKLDISRNIRPFYLSLYFDLL